MQWKILTLALLAEHCSGQMFKMMRFGCSQLTTDRIDPLVNPGAMPGPHLHQIVGGNSFNTSMDPATHDLPTVSTCTSCTFSEDFSNYWTAVLYFRARNGSYKRVPQFSSSGIKANGGILVYYIPPYDGKTKVTAFKPGFRMLVGDASLRSQGSAYAKKVCHRCMPLTGEGTGVECQGSDTTALPKAPCPGGIRSVITFPTCWDGNHTDTQDHKSHVAYPASGTFDSGGACPGTHPVKIPQLMYEVMWDVSTFCSSPGILRLAVSTGVTAAGGVAMSLARFHKGAEWMLIRYMQQTRPFNDKSIWPEDGSQPFFWSTGDK